MTPVFVDAINIYETYNAGGVVDVEVLSPEGSWLSVWQADHPMVITTSRMFSVPIEKVSCFCIYIYCTYSKSEIYLYLCCIYSKRDLFVSLFPYNVVETSSV